MLAEIWKRGLARIKGAIYDVCTIIKMERKNYGIFDNEY